MAAIDLDGTLLGSDHQNQPGQRARRFQQLREAGAHCTCLGQAFFRHAKIRARALPGVHWIVSCQGGELSDVDRKTVVSRMFLSGERRRSCGNRQRRAQDFTPLAYSVEGIFTDAPWNAEMDFYTDLAGHRPVILSTAELFTREVFKVI